MYKRGTKPETFFFTFDLIPGTKNGVLRYAETAINLKEELSIIVSFLFIICLKYTFLCQNY